VQRLQAEHLLAFSSVGLLIALDKGDLLTTVASPWLNWTTD
jgi:hypothetical protein